MDEAQADGNISYIVTFGHRPAYSTGHHSGEVSLKEILDGLGDAHSKYVLNVNSHSHNYERSFPQHGVVHLTVGTGGKNLETDGACLWLICTQPDWSDFRAMHHGFAQLHFSKTGIEGSFICGPSETDRNDITCNPGEVVDSFTIGTPKQSLSAASHLSGYGISVKQAYDWLMANVDNPGLIFATAKQYGVTTAMLAEIVGYSVGIVRSYFAHYNLDSTELDGLV
jgi:hypothetical protein